MINALPRTVELLTEAMFALDGGAMFGIIPRPLWDRTNPGDDQNRIDLACRCMLVRYDDGTDVLVDVGIGTKWSEKERGIYKIGHQDAQLETALAGHGLSPSDIDHVVLTHLHFDHAGGLGRLDERGAVVASFPNATHWVQRKNWGWANSPSARDGGSYRPVDFSFLGDDGAPLLELVDGPSELLPGIEVFVMNGHTFGMQPFRGRDRLRRFVRAEGTPRDRFDSRANIAHIHRNHWQVTRKGFPNRCRRPFIRRGHRQCIAGRQ